LRPLIDEAPSVDERRPRLSDTVSLREACSDELDGVARLQLDVFLPSTPTPTFVPMLSEMMAGNQRAVRAGMRRQLCSDIAVRVSKGSDILVAAVPADGAARQQHAAVYAEADVRLLGTVDLSSQEVALPTHPLSEGLYLSHMAVDPQFRRHGVGRKLLAAAEAAARARAAGGGIYLHVERTNAGARSLYEQCGFVRLPDTAPHAAFTCALNVQH
jgi:ribosomal protein S18 acetylase RimI-like enzyme